MDKDLNESVKKKDNKAYNHGLQIIKHPSYQTYGKRLLNWFDIRVFYVRINNFMVDGYTPSYLTLNHIPLDPDTVLEVNGKRCTLQSEDSIRLSGGVKFEVFDGEDLVLSGILEKSNEKWSMSCESMICGNNGFLKGKQTVGCDSLPMIEVYVAGSFSGSPIILTKTLQIKKQNRKGMLDSIPEYETNESQKDFAPQVDREITGYQHYEPTNDENYEGSLYWSQSEYMDGEDGALSWFNAGVRVGVGIGLGVCLGVGIGVGLLVRTYRSTSRTFRRRI